MRIGLVSREYPPETATGGIGTQTYIKAHGLAPLAQDTELYRTDRHMEAMGNRARKFVAKHAESKHCVENVANFCTRTIAAVKL